MEKVSIIRHPFLSVNSKVSKEVGTLLKHYQMNGYHSISYSCQPNAIQPMLPDSPFNCNALVENGIVREQLQDMCLTGSKLLVLEEEQEEDKQGPCGEMSVEIKIDGLMD